jgi:hypothetical protein
MEQDQGHARFLIFYRETLTKARERSIVGINGVLVCGDAETRLDGSFIH